MTRANIDHIRLHGCGVLDDGDWPRPRTAASERDAALEQLAATGQANERLAGLVETWKMVTLWFAVVAISVCGWTLWRWWR